MNEPGFLDAVASTPLLQRSLIAGALTGLCCASLSPLVVLRRMAFIGDGMAHASFGGIGLALFVLAGSRYEDLGVRLVTIAFCLVLGAAIGVASRRTETAKLGEDSAIGIAFSVSMALGLLFLYLRQRREPQYVPALDTYLFGSPLNVGTLDVTMLAAIAAAVLLALLLFQKEIQFYVFDARLAEVSGVNAGFIHYLFILLLVLAVVIASRMVGIVLVSASLVLPGIAALKVCARLRDAIALSTAIGVVSFVAGLYGSYALNLHPGSTIVLLQFLLLIVAGLSQWTATRPAH